MIFARFEVVGALQRLERGYDLADGVSYLPRRLQQVQCTSTEGGIRRVQPDLI